jgi:hypothetical protein
MRADDPELEARPPDRADRASKHLGRRRRRVLEHDLGGLLEHDPVGLAARVAAVDATGGIGRLCIDARCRERRGARPERVEIE